ncbi:hypothetical protein MNBD_PLANCTO03-1688 [hydrothermal vent metagenome]|uniref:Uncharacterized protein n=1 Tax=hydrothermal vent metagenome TaxID=652676 RepID=A0A3B1DUJ3_9ZZZZ
MVTEKPKSLMRNLGEFFGHIAKGVKADPTAPTVQKQEVRQEVEEREETTPDGRKIIVRRTTIEEIEINEENAPKNQTEGDS